MTESRLPLVICHGALSTVAFLFALAGLVCPYRK